MAQFSIWIDPEVCDGDRLCCELAPATFEMDDDGRARVVNPSGDSPEDILEAAKSCPLQGIRLFEPHTGRQLWPVLDCSC